MMGKNQDKKTFMIAFGTMARLMQLPPPKDADYNAYFAYFVKRGLTLDDMIAICEEAPAKLRIYGRLPTIAELLECRPGETHDQRAARAWDAVIKQIKVSGTQRGVDFDDRNINAAVRSIGGWGELGQTHPDQLDWRRREFVQAYKGCMANAPDPGLCAPLNGSGIGSDKDNANRRVLADTGMGERQPALTSGSEMSAGEVLGRLGVEV